MLKVCAETKTEGINPRNTAAASNAKDCLLLSIMSLLSRVASLSRIVTTVLIFDGESFLVLGCDAYKHATWTGVGAEFRTPRARRVSTEHKMLFVPRLACLFGGKLKCKP